MALTGIFGKPFVDLSGHLDLSELDALHEEICLGLTQLSPSYTGGSHRSMGIVPPSLQSAPWGDYGEVLRAMTDEAFATFACLADEPSLRAARRDAVEFGEERDAPLSRRQMLWLKYRFGVYFPWKVYVEMIPNERWEDKAKSEGKAFTRIARTLFPRTLAFVERLPFERIGRCNLMGLESNDFGTVHRDGVPGETPEVDHFIAFCPAKGKRLFLWDEEAKAKTFVDARAYWFNDRDYHGVEEAPFFRYSIRVDGVFHDAFLQALRGDRG